MNCKEYEDLLDAFLEDDLSEEDKQRMQEHERICPSCTRLKQDMENIVGELSFLEKEPPAGMHDAIMKRLKETKTEHVVQYTPKFRMPHFTILGAVAAALLLFASGSFGNLLQWFSPQDEAMLKTNTAMEDAKASEDMQSKALPFAQMIPENSVTQNQESAIMGEDGATRNQTEKYAGAGDIEFSTNSILFNNETIYLPDNWVDTKFGFYVLAKGQQEKEMPLLATAVEKIFLPEENTTYLLVKNNLNNLENITKELEQYGYEVIFNREKELGTDQNAEYGLIIIMT